MGGLERAERLLLQPVFIPKAKRTSEVHPRGLPEVTAPAFKAHVYAAGARF